MNNNIHHSKYLQSIKTKDIIVDNMKQGRTRRLLYRDISNLSNNSMEGGAGGGGGGSGGGEYHAQSPASVPFIWESSPGTPKRHVNINSKVCNNIESRESEFLPPLTPPPSYQYNNAIIKRPSISKKKKQNDGNSKNSNLIQTVFPRLSLKRDHPPSLSSSPSSKSTSSPSPSSSTSPPSSLERRRLSFDSRAEIEAEMFTYNGYKSYVVRSSPSRQGKRSEEEEDEVVDGGDSPVSTLCFRRFTCCNVKLRGLYSTWF